MIDPAFIQLCDYAAQQILRNLSDTTLTDEEVVHSRTVSLIVGLGVSLTTRGEEVPVAILRLAVRAALVRPG